MKPKKSRPILAAAIKGLLGVICLSGLGGYKETGPMILALILGVGLLAWAVLPFLKKKKKTIFQHVQATREDEPPTPEEPEKIEYPFVNLGMANALSPVDFIVLDTETTGFSPKDDKVIEFAAVKIQNGKETWFSSLVNPGRPIPTSSKKIHGISDEDVKDAPAFKQLLPELEMFLDPDLPIIGQNVTYDLRMLWWEYHDAGRDIPSFRFVDTYKLAKKAFPGRESYALSSLIHDYRLIEGEQTHRAESDVAATLALYRRCCSELAGKK